MPYTKHTKPAPGVKYGRWTVLSEASPYIVNSSSGKPRIKSRFNCVCSCGAPRVVLGTSLACGLSNSCGCLRGPEVRRRKVYRRNQSPEDSAINQLYAQYKAAALNKVRAWGLTRSEFVTLIKSPCHYCGSDPTNLLFPITGNKEFYRNGIDRVDSGGSYTLDNVVPCCKRCNWGKGDRDRSEFIEWAVQVARYSGGVP